MFSRRVSWVLGILVAVVMATGYCVSDATEGPAAGGAGCGQQLSVETAAAAAVLAVTGNCTAPSTAAIVAFLRRHLLSVVGTQGWADAVRRHPEAVIRVSQLVAGAGSETATPTPAVTTDGVVQCPTLTPNETADAIFRNLSGEEKGWTMIEAALEGEVEDMQRLLAVGADVGARSTNMFTALHWAAHNGHAEAVACLLAAGAEVDARNSAQTTPLQAAAISGRTAVLRLLLAASADPNARNDPQKTALHYAALNGHAEAAAVLLAAGADRAAQDAEGLTPKDLARQNNHQQLADLL